jgi:hypothetical protein
MLLLGPKGPVHDGDAGFLFIGGKGALAQGLGDDAAPAIETQFLDRRAGRARKAGHHGPADAQRQAGTAEQGHEVAALQVAVAETLKHSLVASSFGHFGHRLLPLSHC